MEEIKNVLIDLAVITIPVVAAFLVAWLRSLIKKLNEDMVNAKQIKHINIASDFIITTVQRLQQTVVDGLKNSRKDGKLTIDEIEYLESTCKRIVLASLSKEAILVIEEIFGDIEEWIQGKVESTVLALK